jgi:hypothetical protein
MATQSQHRAFTKYGQGLGTIAGGRVAPLHFRGVHLHLHAGASVETTGDLLDQRLSESLDFVKAVITPGKTVFSKD